MQKKGRAGTSRAGKIALYGMMTALAFLLSYVETLIPINLGVPGVKLGLANGVDREPVSAGSRCGSGDCIGAYRVGRIYVWKPVDDAV